jgi:hypothetical protein
MNLVPIPSIDPKQSESDQDLSQYADYEEEEILEE